MSKKSVGKTQQARNLAMQYKDLPYHELKGKIKEMVPCGNTTAHNAIRWMERETKPKTLEETAEKPRLKIESELPRRPLAPRLEPLPEGKVVSEVPVIPTGEKPLEEVKEIPEVPEPEQIQVMKSTLRSLHILFLSKKGILGEKYGNNEDAVVEVSDMAYRYMAKRIGVETLERWDTVFLLMGYAGLIATPAWTFVKERREKAAKEKKKETKKE